LLSANSILAFSFGSTEHSFEHIVKLNAVVEEPPYVWVCEISYDVLLDESRY